MSDNLGLGKIITTEQQRDAIHIAVAPVVAGGLIAPAQSIRFHVNDTETVFPCSRSEGIGIADPFLQDNVRKGQRFWMYLYPGTITSLRHDWTHPAFGVAKVNPMNSAEESKARIWLEELATSLDMTYDDLMSYAHRYLRYGDYTTEYGSSHWRDTFSGKQNEFWIRYEIVTGKCVQDKDTNFFSCSC